jgi:two-component system sensor histidine kinase RpfC
MFQTLIHFRNKLAARPDTEHVQIYLRMLAGLGGITYSVFAHKYTNQVGGWNLTTQIYIVAAGLIVGGFGFLIYILRSPGINFFRRWLGAIHDSVWVGLALYALGDVGMMFFGMYIWVVIGNGFRYGTRFLYGSATLALLSFYTVAYFSPYYRSNFGFLGLGTFLLAFVIPVYCGGLLKKLQQNLVAAREADRLKTRFLSNVSHDLRTPLNVIMANCDLLAREPGNITRQSRRLQDMQEAATTLNGLLVDLLDVARIEAGRIKIMPSRFNMIELLGRVTRFNQSAAQANGIQIYLTVAPDTPVQVYGDTLRLEQVLNNIVSNAVKYTENGHVAIYARPDIDQDTGVCNGIICSVTDTGIGIDPEAMGRIFSRFEQADLAYARRYSGAGLGLNIANELTALMGGSIDVKSAKGEGSCFTLTVPLRIDQDFDFDSAFVSRRTHVAVICGNTERQRYWIQRFDGTTLPSAQVFTVKTLANRVEALAGDHADPAILVVDAFGLDITIDEVSSLAGGFFGKPLVPRILVNAPRVREENEPPSSVYKNYRCWTIGAAPDDVKKALAIGYWTTGSEPSRTESDEELWSWMSALRGLTVLVADDNELNRHVLSDILAYADAGVMEARDGADALAILSEEHIDIALLDIQMPELTGVEVMRALAGQKPERPVPVIALTADTTEECRAECLNAGAKAILHKPVDMKTLYHELYQIVVGTDPGSPFPQRHCTPTAPERGLLDYSFLQELTETGRRLDYVATLVLCFKQEGEHLLRGLRHAFSLNELADSRTLLHRLKGMCGSIGAREMAAICQESLALSDAELCASADKITKALLQLHKDSARLLDTFSESVLSNNPNHSLQRAQS